MKIFAPHKLEAFNIVIRFELKIHKKNNNPESLHVHSLKDHQVGGGM